MPHYVEDFSAAMAALAGDGHIKQRLTDVFDRHLSEISVSELPVSVREAYADLKLSVTQVEPINGEGPICASIRKMSIAEASRCAAQFVKLYAEIVKSGSDAESARPVREAPPRMAVPAMLLKSV